MKVYACLNCHYNGADYWVSLEKIVASEERAIEWSEQIAHTESVWREYEEYEVEQ